MSSPTTSEAAAPSTRRWRAAILVPWLLVAALAATSAFTTIRWLDLRDREQVRSDVALAAHAFLVDLTNWDAGELEATITSLRERGTGRFVAQADDLFGTTLGEELAAADATSEGTVEDLFVQSVDGDAAEVFGVVRQTVDSQLTDGPETTVHRAIIRLERVDGTWKIENVQLPEVVLDPLGAPSDVTS